MAPAFDYLNSDLTTALRIIPMPVVDTTEALFTSA